MAADKKMQAENRWPQLRRLIEQTLQLQSGDTFEDSLRCTTFGKSFSKSGNVTKHMRAHCGEPPHKGTASVKSFSTSNSLAMHKRTHSGDRRMDIQAEKQPGKALHKGPRGSSALTASNLARHCKVVV